ncbi:MAG: hypothetical protein HDR33_00075 [Treponema sp.]|nr:hypothetical protein [Treponema sp.]
MFRRTVFWQVHAVFLRKLRDFSENPNWWCFPSTKAASTQKGFPRPGVIFPKTQTGGASPAQKRPPPKKVFIDLARFCRTTKRRCSPGRIFPERQNAVASPGVISPNGKTPLLVLARFPQTAKCRCLPWRDFLERQNAVVCPDVFSSNGKTPPRKKACFFLSVLNFFRYLIK